MCRLVPALLTAFLMGAVAAAGAAEDEVSSSVGTEDVAAFSVGQLQDNSHGPEAVDDHVTYGSGESVGGVHVLAGSTFNMGNGILRGKFTLPASNATGTLQKSISSVDIDDIIDKALMPLGNTLSVLLDALDSFPFPYPMSSDAVSTGNSGGAASPAATKQSNGNPSFVRISVWTAPNSMIPADEDEGAAAGSEVVSSESGEDSVGRPAKSLQELVKEGKALLDVSYSCYKNVEEQLTMGEQVPVPLSVTPIVSRVHRYASSLAPQMARRGNVSGSVDVVYYAGAFSQAMASYSDTLRKQVTYCRSLSGAAGGGGRATATQSHVGIVADVDNFVRIAEEFVHNIEAATGKRGEKGDRQRAPRVDEEVIPNCDLSALSSRDLRIMIVTNQLTVKYAQSASKSVLYLYKVVRSLWEESVGTPKNKEGHRDHIRKYVELLCKHVLQMEIYDEILHDFYGGSGDTRDILKSAVNVNISHVIEPGELHKLAGVPEGLPSSPFYSFLNPQTWRSSMSNPKDPVGIKLSSVVPGTVRYVHNLLNVPNHKSNADLEDDENGFMRLSGSFPVEDVSPSGESHGRRRKRETDDEPLTIDTSKIPAPPNGFLSDIDTGTRLYRLELQKNRRPAPSQGHASAPGQDGGRPRKAKKTVKGRGTSLTLSVYETSKHLKNYMPGSGNSSEDGGGGVPAIVSIGGSNPVMASGLSIPGLTSDADDDGDNKSRSDGNLAVDNDDSHTRIKVTDKYANDNNNNNNNSSSVQASDDQQSSNRADNTGDVDENVHIYSEKSEEASDEADEESSESGDIEDSHFPYRERYMGRVYQRPSHVRRERLFPLRRARLHLHNRPYNLVHVMEPPRRPPGTPWNYLHRSLYPMRGHRVWGRH